MSEPKHTKGPWHVVDCRESDKFDNDYIIADENANIVARIENTPLLIEQEANAYLIEKAPMMREVLLQCLQYMQKSPFLRNEQLENAITALVKEP